MNDNSGQTGRQLACKWQSWPSGAGMRRRPCTRAARRPAASRPPVRARPCLQAAPPAHQVEVWKKGVCSDTFHPRFRSTAMRERLTGGSPEAPLLLSVGRLGNEKNLKFLKVKMQRVCVCVEGWEQRRTQAGCRHEALPICLPACLPSSVPVGGAGTLNRSPPPPPPPPRQQDVLARVPGARLAFVGDGPAREELQVRVPRLLPCTGLLAGTCLPYGACSPGWHAWAAVPPAGRCGEDRWLQRVGRGGLGSGTPTVPSAAGGKPAATELHVIRLPCLPMALSTT